VERDERVQHRRPKRHLGEALVQRGVRVPPALVEAHGLGERAPERPAQVCEHGVGEAAVERAVVLRVGGPGRREREDPARARGVAALVEQLGGEPPPLRAPRVQDDAGRGVDAPAGEADRAVDAGDRGQRGEQAVRDALDVLVVADEARVGHEVEQEGRAAAVLVLVRCDAGLAALEVVEGLDGEQHEVPDLRGERDHPHAAQDVLEARAAQLLARVRVGLGRGLVRRGLDPPEGALGEPERVALDGRGEGLVAPRGALEGGERRAEEAGRQEGLEGVAGLLPHPADRGVAGPVRELGQGPVEVGLARGRVREEAHGDREAVQQPRDAEPLRRGPVQGGLDAGEGGADLVRGPGRVEGREGLAPAPGALVQLHGQPVVERGHVRGGEQERVRQAGVPPRVERLLVRDPGQLGPQPEQVRGDVRLVARRARAARGQHEPDELQVDVRERLLQLVQLAGRGGRVRVRRAPGLAEEAQEPPEGLLEPGVVPDRRPQRLEPGQRRRQERPGQKGACLGFTGPA